MARLRLGVLISGRGSNLQALLAAASGPGYPARIACVISSRAGAEGIARARDAGIPVRVVAARDFAAPEACDAAVDAALRAARTDLVCLAGYMRILGRAFVAAWRDRLINIHPSLLPAFPGRDAQGQALAAGVRISGCTVHFVRPRADSGPIIAQAAVPVADGDDAATLGDRILAAEHRLYPRVVRLIAEGRVAVAGGRVVVSGPAELADGLAAPGRPRPPG